MSNYERRSNGSVLSTVALSLALFNIGNLVGHLAGDDKADNRVHDVQIENAQVYKQLTQNHSREVGELALNDEEHSFVFHTNTVDGKPEICSGHYEEKDNTARLVGDLACTQIVPAQPN